MAPTQPAPTQPASDAIIQALVGQGRRSGNRLSAEALGAALPIETMTPEEIAAVVERIETAGVEVELDDSRLMRSRGAPSGDYRRGDGVVDIASPAAPAVSAPGAVPSRHGWADDIAAGTAHGAHGASPTWTRDGVEMLPLASLVGVALVLLIALGGH